MIGRVIVRLLWRSSLGRFSPSSTRRECTERCGCWSTWNMKMWVKLFLFWFCPVVNRVCVWLCNALQSVLLCFCAGDWPPRRLFPSYFSEGVHWCVSLPQVNPQSPSLCTLTWGQRVTSATLNNLTTGFNKLQPLVLQQWTIIALSRKHLEAGQQAKAKWNTF